MRYKVKNLVSNLANFAKNQDTLLQGAFDIINISKKIYSSNFRTNTVTEYNKKGNKIFTINLTNGTMPTGLEVNDTQLFRIGNGSVFVPSKFIIATLDGNILAYNPFVNFKNAVNVVNNTNKAAYVGLAIANNRLLVANTRNRTVQLFESNFQPVIYDGVVISPFFDPNIPQDYSPYNIVNIDNRIYITYVKVNNDRAVPGIGFGFVSEFTVEGKFVRRIASGGVLNAPYAIIEASHDFKLGKNVLLISNFGDGKINAFSKSGKFIKTLKIENKHGDNIVLEGLRGLVKFDNKVYFASSPDNQTNGLIGYIKRD